MKKLIPLLILLLFFACQDQNSEFAEEEYSNSQSKKYINQLSEMGFSIEQLVEYKKYFIVEDDILIYKSDIELIPSKQKRTPNLVSSTIAPNIRVKIHSSISGWTNIIEDAIDQWNDVNSNLQFTISNTSPHITIYGDASSSCPIEFRNLAYNVCGRGSFPSSSGQPGATISINTDSPFITTTAKRLRTVTHEFGHCIGFYHTNMTSGTLIANTPSNDANSLMNGGECGRTITLSTSDETGLCELYCKGEVSSGKTKDLDFYRNLYATCLADGKSVDDVVAFAIAGSNDYSYVWYDDYKMSYGSTNNLDRYGGLYTYSLAPGKSPNDIVGIGIAGSNDRCYVWYDNGTVSSGSSRDLDKYRSPYSYSLAPGKYPNDIIGVAIAGSNDRCYVWYDNGTASSGSSSDLDKYRSPYNFSLASGKSIYDVAGVAIAGSNDRCYVLYEK